MVTDLQNDPLSKAREAFARHAWIEAFDQFAAADALGQLPAQDLEAMGDAAWWTGRHGASIEINERAFAAYLDSGEPRRAAMVALALVVSHTEAGARSVAGGWLRRAVRLVEDEPECPEKGHVELRLGIRAHMRGLLDEALEHEGRALDIGMRFGDRDLQGLALSWQGKARLLKGEVDEGMSLLEEATAAAVGGDLSPRATGIVYCLMIAICQQLADYSRAGEWTEAARRWCDRQAIAGFPGICRVHRAEILRLRGRWEEAELEARQAHEELKEFDVGVAGDALYEVGEVRLRMGDLDGAGEALRQAHELGHPGQPALALLSLERGDAETALGLITAALKDEWHPLFRAQYLPALVETAVAANDLGLARTAADEMEKLAADFRTEALEAMAASSRGQVQLAEGDPAACRSFTRSYENHPKWEREVLEIRPLTPGPVRVGSRAIMVREDFGRRSETEYEIVAFEPGRRIAARHSNAAMFFELEFTVEPAPGGSSFTASGTSSHEVRFACWDRSSPSVCDGRAIDSQIGWLHSSRLSRRQVVLPSQMLGPHRADVAADQGRPRVPSPLWATRDESLTPLSPGLRFGDRGPSVSHRTPRGRRAACPNTC